MKILITSIILVFCVAINAQKPEKIYSIAKVAKAHDWYVNQAELWWKELEKNKKDEDAWFNYFKANRYAAMTYVKKDAPEGHEHDGWVNEGKNLMEADDIAKLVQQYIPDSYANNSMKVYGYSAEDESFKYLIRAYEIDSTRPEAMDGLVTYYETHGDMQKRKEFNLKWFKTNDLSSGFLNYNYNVLMSLKPNGVILTFGDNDTYPMWMLQDVFGIRTDLVILNVPLLADQNYRNIMFKKLNIPIFTKSYPDGSSSISERELMTYIINNKPQSMLLYIGLPAWKEMKEFENKLYMVGLVIEYSEENIDNLALLKNNFENKYALDYIKNRFEYDICDELVNRMNINYLPGIFKLYEHYTISGDIGKAQKMKELGLFIAQKGGHDWIDKATKILK